MISSGFMLVASLLIMNANVDPSFALGSGIVGKRDILDLQGQHRQLSPLESMSSITKSLELLGIEKFDVYGDFVEGMFNVELSYLQH